MDRLEDLFGATTVNCFEFILENNFHLARTVNNKHRKFFFLKYLSSYSKLKPITN